MTEENNNCYYSRNYIPYNINHGLSDLNSLGTNANSLAQSIYISDVSYMRQNTNQYVNNMNNPNLFQVLIEMKKEIQELKTKEKNYNVQMLKMIQEFKTKENNLNTKIDIIKNDNKALNKKLEGMEIEMNNLRAFAQRIIKKLNEMDEAVKSINIPLINNENLRTQIELLKQKLKFLEENLCQLKNDVVQKNQNNIKEISRLEKEVKELKERINELQSLFVGRKLIKIILKIIIEYCFQNYSAEGTTIQVKGLKDKKYIPYIKIANNLIEIVLKKNKIIHINGEINKIIDIINDKTTYGDILNLVKDSLKKNDFQNILDLLKEKSLFNQICEDQIIGKDEDLNTIINKQKNYE